MQLYRKIGGIHWLALGRLRFSFCVTRKRPQLITGALKPIDLATLPARIDHASLAFLWRNRVLDL